MKSFTFPFFFAWSKGIKTRGISHISSRIIESLESEEAGFFLPLSVFLRNPDMGKWRKAIDRAGKMLLSKAGREGGKLLLKTSVFHTAGTKIIQKKINHGNRQEKV